tara:strand:- start:374 stop:601 length:228 start_codon:yes stop_codon:yes gene_type:complete
MAKHLKTTSKTTFKFDGRSRVSNATYEKRWNEIFGKKSNPMAKEVRTPKYKPKVVKSKKTYNRKKKEKHDTWIWT